MAAKIMTDFNEKCIHGVKYEFDALAAVEAAKQIWSVMIGPLARFLQLSKRQQKGMEFVEFLCEEEVEIARQNGEVPNHILQVFASAESKRGKDDESDEKYDVFGFIVS